MDRPKLYVLVHGAWHGAWCWKYLLPRLQSLGHTVLTPDLPGHGQDKTAFRVIHLSTYVDFLIDLIKQQSKPVVLVGHSFAGVVISQVAEEIPESIERLVYVAGFVPQNQHSLMNEAIHNQNSDKLIIPLVKEYALALNAAQPVVLKDYLYHCCDASSVAFALQNIQKEPILPFSEPVALSRQNFGNVPKKYIYCLQDQAVDLANQRRMAENACIEDSIKLDCDHSPFFSMPSQLLLALHQTRAQN